MINIREGVYETNSSSSHSLSIEGCPKNLYQTITPNEDGVIRFQLSPIDYSFDETNDILFKLNCIVCAIYTSARDHYNRYKGEFDINNLDETNQKRMNMLLRVIINNTKAEKVEFNVGNVDYEFPCMTGNIDPKIFESDENLRDFLFSPLSDIYMYET
jgi:hypothetical protein